jgi:hypothetical protein
MARADRTAHPAWAPMLAECSRLALPEVYRNDVFVIDRDYLEIARPVRFVWTLSPTGSHMVTSEPRGSTHKAVRAAESVERHFGYVPEFHWYSWDGANLDEITYAGAREFLRQPCEEQPDDGAYRVYSLAWGEEQEFGRAAASDWRWSARHFNARPVPNWGWDPA